jgi:hypothetical protein
VNGGPDGPPRAAHPAGTARQPSLLTAPAAGWRALLQPGDLLVLAVGAALCASLVPLVWRGGTAEKAQIRADGKLFAELDLAARKTLQVPGPLGTTVIAVDAGRARVVADPGPRQYCVHQGWLSRPGDVAICAPNRVSLQILGHGGGYDSLAY